jgi:AraC-like DNA-binding protein
MESLPRPVFARVKSLPGGSWKPWHAHSWAQFTYAIKGVLVVRTDQGTFLAPPQRAVWIPPDVRHEVVTSVRTERRNFFIDPAKVAWNAPACRVLEISPFVRELIRVIAGLPVEYDEQGPDGRLAQVFLDQIILLPEVEFSLPMPSTPSLFEYCSELVLRPDEQLPMARIAKASGMSERTMARVFQRETGLSFREWRVRLRLLTSIEGLEACKNVTKTAFDCGYDSISAFIAAFKRHFGKTPGEFLKSLEQ